MKKLFLTLLLLPSLVMATDFKTAVSGKKLTFDGATCAGVSFSKDGAVANMYDEQVSNCNLNIPFLLRVKWLNDNTAILVEKVQKNKSAPPRVFVMQFQSLNGNRVTVKDVWVGWGNHPDQIQKYTIK
ncbi:MAG: hypothetical protein J6589_07510 [Snodgrassella sp.]|uniref:hypothetical protein n=1 Tax=Snodgrassella sp. TaxID=2815304 RepID=UPI0025880ACB|nr:hypothetical protein [Snodgrassella sp.]MCO6514297.1 hypothetical protein [Snodgrassella sp.]MCO6520552.1 hypothetical protein [Snodgrassella sp.]